MELHEIIMTAEIKIAIALKNIFLKNFFFFFLELYEHTEWNAEFHNFQYVISELF